jgi:hypothetical protein
VQGVPVFVGAGARDNVIHLQVSVRSSASASSDATRLDLQCTCVLPSLFRAASEP